MAKIVVVGGSGNVGARVVEKLRAHGHDAVAVSRRDGVNAYTGEGLADAFAGADAVVGFDGETYLEGLGNSNVLDVRKPGSGRCTARFDLPGEGAALPRIGPVACLPYELVHG